VTGARSKSLRVFALAALMLPSLGSSGSIERQVVEVRRTLERGSDAYTQGLLWYRQKLYESTGQYGQSRLRRIDAASGLVEKETTLSAMFFGEGLARVEERLIQLTWRSGVALVYDLESLDEVARFSYEGQGWGLCYDGRRLVMSDGSDRLTFRDPDSFEATRSVGVTLDSQPLYRLNELECVEGWIYANVYQSETIVRIDPSTGAVLTTVDASGLLSPQELDGVDVLNGIAYDPDDQTFFLTGKYWPKLFEVRFVAKDR